jgi:hypothetical protein
MSFTFYILPISGERSDLMYSHCKVDLTAYIERHEFDFDAVLHEHVTNDEVTAMLYFLFIYFRKRHPVLISY